jgi:hypothetical protein
VPQDDAGERDPDLPEDLDRHEEPCEEKDDAEELADEEPARRAKAVQAAGDGGNYPADCDEDGRGNPAVDGPVLLARYGNAPRSCFRASLESVTISR